MKRFPDFVCNSMRSTGSTVTCLPVQFDHVDAWEAAIFFCVGGPECKEDRRTLNRLESTIPVSIEADLIDHANAAIVVLRLEVYTSDSNPLSGEVLLTPGEAESHFKTVKLLSEQPALKWFFSDAAYKIIHSQQIRLGLTQHKAFAAMLDESVKHDALIRMTGRYDVGNALNDVLAHYAPRA